MSTKQYKWTVGFWFGAALTASICLSIYYSPKHCPCNTLFGEFVPILSVCLLMQQTLKMGQLEFLPIGTTYES